MLLSAKSVFLPELLSVVKKTSKNDKLINSSLFISQFLKEGYKHIKDINLYPQFNMFKPKLTKLQDSIYVYDLEILIPKEVLNEYFNKEFFYLKNLPKKNSYRHYVIEEFIEPLKKKGTICYLGIKPHDKFEYYDEVLELKRKNKKLFFGVWY